MRYILLDRVTEIVVGERAAGIKCVTLTDEVLQDHFPDYPILPGVLLVEAAAQLAGFLLEVSDDEAGAPPRRAVLVQIAKAKFHRPAQPGDAVRMFAEIDGTLDGAAQVQIGADIDGEKAMRGKLTFMMKHIDSARLHEQRRSLYRLWTRDLASEVHIP